MLEITLRTPVAMDCLERDGRRGRRRRRGRRHRAQPGDASRAAAAAGARFCVSPGLIEGETAGERAPLLPGIATATELIAGLAAGFTNFKLFPPMSWAGSRP